jgi:putative redox protein
MKTRVKWAGDLMFVGESESGHAIAFGRGKGPDGSFRAAGPSALELMLIGMGGCTAYDVVTILEKGRQALAGCDIAISADRAGTDPKVFTRVHLHFTVSGPGLDPAKVERAIRLSADKYCSASAMIGKVAEVTHDFEVIDTAA